MLLISIFALLCSASVCGMESNFKEIEDDLRRKWGAKLYCPLNDYLDKGLSPKLQKRATSLQEMLKSKNNSAATKKIASEIVTHYHRVACFVDKETSDAIYYWFPNK